MRLLCCAASLLVLVGCTGESAKSKPSGGASGAQASPQAPNQPGAQTGGGTTGPTSATEPQAVRKVAE